MNDPTNQTPAETKFWAEAEKRYPNSSLVQESAKQEKLARYNEVVSERDELARWKSERLMVDEWWNGVAELVRGHPSMRTGESVAKAAKRMIEERYCFEIFRWVPVTERMPKVGDIIACYAEHKDGGLMYWAGWVFDVVGSSAFMEVRGEVTQRFVITDDTHWMPLPAMRWR